MEGQGFAARPQQQNPVETLDLRLRLVVAEQTGQVAVVEPFAEPLGALVAADFLEGLGLEFEHLGDHR